MNLRNNTLNSCSVQDLLETGDKFWRKKDYAAVITCYTHAIELDSENYDAHVNRGAGYNELKQYDNAIADCDKAMQLNPRSNAAYNNRGYAYWKLQQYDHAIADFTQALVIDPNATKTKDNLEACKKAAVKHYLDQGRAFQEQKHDADAVQCCTKAIEIDPENYNAYIKRGACYNELNQHDNAIADCNKAIRLNPRSGTAYNNRGYAYWKLQQYDHAIADFKRALAIDPNATKTKDNLENCERIAANARVSQLSQLTEKMYSDLALNEKTSTQLTVSIPELLKQDKQLLVLLIELIKKLDATDPSPVNKKMIADINQLLNYPSKAFNQTLENIPAITPHLSGYFQRKEAVNRYISKVARRLLSMKDEINSTDWKIQHWLTGKLISGTPSHIKKLKQLLACMNEYSSTTAILETYSQVLNLLSGTDNRNKRRLPETQQFYDKSRQKLAGIMLNPPNAIPDAIPAEELPPAYVPVPPPSYAEHIAAARIQQQLAILNQQFPNYRVEETSEAFFLTCRSTSEPRYPIIIDKNQFDKQVAEKLKPVAAESFPHLFAFFTPVAAPETTPAAASEVAIPAAQPLLFPPVPTHELAPLNQAGMSTDKQTTSSPRKMVYAA